MKNRHPSPWRGVRLHLEALEDRCVPAVYWWFPTGSDFNWATGANWLDEAHGTRGIVPDSIDYAYFGTNGGNNTDCIVNGTFTVDRVIMGLGDYTSTMTVGYGQSVTTAWGFTQSGTLNLIGGTITTNTNIYVSGVVNATQSGSIPAVMTAASTLIEGTLNVVRDAAIFPVFDIFGTPGDPLEMVINSDVINGGTINVGTALTTPFSPVRPSYGRLSIVGSSITVGLPNTLNVFTPSPSFATSTLTFTGGASGIFNVIGTVSLSAGTITTDTRVRLNRGGLQVTRGGLINGANGSVYNQGSITWLGALNTLTIAGSYTEYSPYDGSTLNMRITTGGSDGLSVGGVAELHGILSVTVLAGGALPPGPTVWTLIAAGGGIVSDFHTFILPPGPSWGHAINPGTPFTTFTIFYP